MGNAKDLVRVAICNNVHVPSVTFKLGTNERSGKVRSLVILLSRMEIHAVSYRIIEVLHLRLVGDEIGRSTDRNSTEH